jgi:PPE-repeat protein
LRNPAYGFARHKGYGTAEHLAAPADAPTATAPTADTANTAANKTQGDSDNPLNADEKKRRKTGGIGLAQKVSRVTVLLPTRSPLPNFTLKSLINIAIKNSNSLFQRFVFDNPIKYSDNTLFCSRLTIFRTKKCNSFNKKN